MTRKKLKTVSLVGMIISAAVWIALPFALRDVTLSYVYIGEVLALTLGGIPTAFLQLRLCLTDREKWVRWVPTAVAAMTYIAAGVMLVCDSFDGLLSLIIAVFGLAPCVGICLGWLAYGKRAALVPLSIIFIAYLVISRVPIVSRPFELTDAAAAVYMISGICLALKPLPAEQK